MFGLQTTLPVRESVYIIQMKECRHFIALEARLTLSPEHQAILKAVPRAYLEKLMQEVVLKVFLAEMGLRFECGSAISRSPPSSRQHAVQ